MAKNPTLAFGPKTANQNKNIRIIDYPSEIGAGVHLRAVPTQTPTPNSASASTRPVTNHIRSPGVGFETGGSAGAPSDAGRQPRRRTGISDVSCPKDGL